MFGCIEPLRIAWYQSFLPEHVTPLTAGIGNEHDEDSDKESEPPPKVADKPVARTGKRNAPDTAPSESYGGGAGGDRAGRGGPRSGYSGNDEGTLLVHPFSLSNPFSLGFESLPSTSSLTD